MPGTTVRVTKETRETLRALAEQVGQPIQKVLDMAVEAYRRQCLLKQANAAYAALRADPEIWREEQLERQLWEGTLRDDLEDQ